MLLKTECEFCFLQEQAVESYRNVFSAFVEANWTYEASQQYTDCLNNGVVQKEAEI